MLVNCLVLAWIRVKERVLVDRMVLLDCAANLLCVVIVLCAFPVRVYRSGFVCIFLTFFRSYVVSIKRWDIQISMELNTYRIALIIHTYVMVSYKIEVLLKIFIW